MMQFILGVVIGLVVGWNLFPQPEWVKNLYDKVRAKIKNLSAK
jgi:hypothetical protein